MNETTNEDQNKATVLKSLAVVGFLGLLALIAWLGIQLISFMPGAFTSLASLADSVYNYKPVELVVVSNKSIANSGEAFLITWNKPKTEGEFTFKYACVDGVSISIRNASGTIDNVECNQEFSLGKVNSMDISITSNNNRFADVPYTITYTRTGAKVAEATKDNTITVVNPTIASVDTVDTTPVATTTPVVIEPTPVPTLPPVVTPTKPPIVTPTKPVVVPTKPVVQTVSSPIFTIPVSNPNGFTDLSVRSIGVGTIDSNNRFTLVGVIDNDYKGAIQFEIKNNGTKTSNSFTFTANLPNGAVYNSSVQTALKPNERAVITVGFDTANLIGVKAFSVKVNDSPDTNLNNNVFNSGVSIKD